MFPSAELKPSATISTVTTGPQLYTDEQRIAARAIMHVGRVSINDTRHIEEALAKIAGHAPPMSDQELSYYVSVR